jgi:hypothetical protein
VQYDGETNPTGEAGMKKGIAVFLAIAGLAASQASATLTSYEGFNYANGVNLDTQSGGTGFAANWGQFLGDGLGYVATTGSLADPTSTLQTSGNKVSTTSTAGFEGRYNNAPPPSQGAAGSTNFWSVLIRPDNLGTQTGLGTTNGGFILQIFSSGGAGDLSVGKSGDNAHWGLENGTQNISSFSSVSAVSNQTVLLVLEEDFTAGADTFKLFVNPSSSTEPAVPNATLSYDIGTQNGFGINTFNGALASFDEIRIGTTYADVTPGLVPEPGTVSLVIGGLAFLGFGVRRRVRRS